jgi:hypothetical protein
VCGDSACYLQLFRYVHMKDIKDVFVSLARCIVRV